MTTQHLITLALSGLWLGTAILLVNTQDRLAFWGAITAFNVWLAASLIISAGT